MEITSPPLTFQGWRFIEFLKGRKKTLVTLVAAGLAYLLTSQADIAFYSGLIVESGLAVAEYYLKPVKYTLKN